MYIYNSHIAINENCNFIYFLIPDLFKSFRNLKISDISNCVSLEYDTDLMTCLNSCIKKSCFTAIYYPGQIKCCIIENYLEESNFEDSAEQSIVKYYEVILAIKNVKNLSALMLF